MPYDVPDPNDACASCEAIHPGAGACEGCLCAIPSAMAEAVRRGYNADDNWDDGYHWRPAMWACDLCGERELVGLHDPVIDADGVTICDRHTCLGAVLRGMEAMRKGGLQIGGPGDSRQLPAETQLPTHFYHALARVGEGPTT